MKLENIASVCVISQVCQIVNHVKLELKAVSGGFMTLSYSVPNETESVLKHV